MERTCHLVSPLKVKAHLLDVALIVPDFVALKEWGKAQNLASLEVADLVENPKVYKLIAEEMQEALKDAKGYEKPKQFKLLSEEFSIQNDLLTPKLSLKRRNIRKKYEEDLKKLYGIPIHEQLSYHGIRKTEQVPLQP